MRGMRWIAVLALSSAQHAEAGVIADSFAEFSSTQGQDNWYYGYYATPGSPASWTQFENFVDNTGDLFPGQVNPGFWRTDSIPTVAIWDTGEAPRGTDLPPEMWAARRWVSETSGSVLISGNIAPTGGGTTTARIYVDGVLIYTQNSAPGGAYAVNASVNVGSVVDLTVSADGVSFFDSTTFTAQIVPDCNANGVHDSDDIASGASCDLDGNDVPDNCEKGFCPGDCADADGVVGILDFLALLSEWGQACTVCDVDGGGVGITDFLELLAHWGPCP